jgi:hypothetical protein
LKFNEPAEITSAVLLAARLSGTPALTVAPETASVPAPLTSEPLSRLRVPPAKFSTAPAATEYTPVSVPPPPTASVPAPTLTVPPLLKAMLPWIACEPATLSVIVPRFAIEAVPV